ncbi:MAG: nuclear transport factor 2 family protein [Gammaproteobacteria bacterium]|jgi:hypothetical protein|nr:nuclear transport factor 2 family protein [Gammaproteobacteria bacterium]MBT5203895.1 nuclear transport factor 2 family protein [Gammaproteobacteria bacterium]MBT5603673.1 nuclear transport factor 2 family protein [Gammaproteobacteria bacterium]MBT6245363.1 nuclear transport factor 2 family protein [Gammaproteobacteria bacterium]
MGELTGKVPDLEELAHRSAITELLSSHSRCLDRLDAIGLKRLYWPESEVDYGGFKGSAHEFAGMVMVALQKQYELTQHRVSNTLIRFEAGLAFSESYVFAKHLSRGGDSEMVFSGRYLDQFELRGKFWKFSHRHVVMDWTRRWTVQDERDSPSFKAMSKGTQDASDLSWPYCQEKSN